MSRKIQFVAFNLDAPANKFTFNVKVKTVKNSSLVVGTILNKLFAWKDVQKVCNVKEGLKSSPLVLKFEMGGKLIDTSKWEMKLQQVLRLGYSAKSKLRFMEKFQVIMDFVMDEEGEVSQEVLMQQLSNLAVLEELAKEEAAIA